jgi:hypothetical protein
MNAGDMLGLVMLLLLSIFGVFVITVVLKLTFSGV